MGDYTCYKKAPPNPPKEIPSLSPFKLKGESPPASLKGGGDVADWFREGLVTPL